MAIMSPKTTKALEGFTEKQRKFLLVLAGDPTENITEAARKAGIDRSHINTVMKQNEKRYRAALTQIRADIMRDSLITGADIIHELWNIGKYGKNDNARVAALTLLGRHLGLQLDKPDPNKQTKAARTITVHRERSN